MLGSLFFIHVEHSIPIICRRFFPVLLAGITSAGREIVLSV
jgi:hypothetical protein